MFNFDATVRRLHAKEKGLQLIANDPQDVTVASHRSTEYRILDRFLVSRDLSFQLEMESGPQSLLICT